MKASRYNYIVPFGDRKILFNGITEAFFLVSPEYEDAYTRILESPDSQGEWAEAFIARMKESGFIVDDDTDELDWVKTKFEALRNGDQYFLMVLPTYQCNLRCWYCIQDHEDLFMDDEVLERTKRLIERRMSDDSIKSLHLSWFGGEPLLAYDKVCRLTAFAQEYAKTHGKTFTCAITTNATLLNEERVERLRELGVSHYQITIDGDRVTHDSVKKLGSASAYDRTLDNVNRIARHTSVSLRFNYTKDNLKPDGIFENLGEKLDPAVRGNIEFTIFKVWQEKQENVREEDVDTLFSKGVQAGMHSTLSASGICYTDHKHYDCVFPNGHMGNATTIRRRKARESFSRTEPLSGRKT